jgi:Flp pilus assembly protein TadG
MWRMISRLREERGATAVMVALLMVPLVGFVGIAVDVGALYAERAQLQNGADAAALAIARDCSAGACGNPATRAATFANLNANDGAANVLTPAISGRSVTVTSSTRVAGTNAAAIAHPFAALIGATPTTVHATATAEWGSLNASRVVLPLAISYCEFRPSLDGTLQLIRYDQNLNCPSRDGHPIPGGFGWLAQASGMCGVFVDIDTARVPSLPGNSDSLPSGCDAVFSTLIGRTILVPIFDDALVTRPVAWYHIYGFAAFTVTGFKFSGNGVGLSITDPAAPSCTGNCRGIQGRFSHWTSLDAAGVELGGPDLGASFVRLTN